MAAGPPVRTAAKAPKRDAFNRFIGFEITDQMRPGSFCQGVMGANFRLVWIGCQPFSPDLPSGELPMAGLSNRAYDKHYFPLVPGRTTTRAVFNPLGGVWGINGVLAGLRDVCVKVYGNAYQQ
jgi:hypothetical protein